MLEANALKLGIFFHQAWRMGTRKYVVPLNWHRYSIILNILVFFNV